VVPEARKEFTQLQWDDTLQAEAEELVRLALQEDLRAAGDVTSRALIDAGSQALARIVTRRPGTVAGLPIVPLVLRQVDPTIRWEPRASDGEQVPATTVLGEIAGPARAILSAERTTLNFLGRLSGIATVTRQYVEAVAGTSVRVFDTRKPTPGWRRLEKYAVRCGGGWNHRTGLFDAVLIKDNHLEALSAGEPGAASRGAAVLAVRRARDFLRRTAEQRGQEEMIVQIEIDHLDALPEVLQAGPDIILLDNMTVDQLRQAVALRNRHNPSVQLEASGNVTLETIRQVALTGVDRISIGALTHSAPWLDIGLDWQ